MRHGTSLAMNLALWLERAGSSHGDRPALGLGSRVVRRYGEVAERAARLAASLRNRLLLQPGERVAIVAKNCPDYLELMFGIGTREQSWCPPMQNCTAARSAISCSIPAPACASHPASSAMRSRPMLRQRLSI